MYSSCVSILEIHSSSPGPAQPCIERMRAPPHATHTSTHGPITSTHALARSLAPSLAIARAHNQRLIDTPCPRVAGCRGLGRLGLRKSRQAQLGQPSACAHRTVLCPLPISLSFCLFLFLASAVPLFSAVFVLPHPFTPPPFLSFFLLRHPSGQVLCPRLPARLVASAASSSHNDPGGRESSR